MTFSTLRALHSIIGSAIDDIERLYHERSPTLDFPSLEDPYYYSGPHTAEEELAEKMREDPVVGVACKMIVAACGHLNATVNKVSYSG